MKIHKFVLTPLILVMVSALGCSNMDQSPDQSEILFDQSALNTFRNSLIEQQPNLSEELVNINIISNDNMSSANVYRRNNRVIEEKAKAIKDFLMKESMTLLRASGFTEDEIKEELGGLESPEVVGAALYLLVLSEEEVSSNTSGVDSENNIMKCLMTATGLEELVNKPFRLASKSSRRALLRAVGKFAIKQLGWIGWALAAGEFIGCYYGNNSVVDMN